jgi:hypothetical protein
LDQFSREALTQLIKEESGDGGVSKRLAKTSGVRLATGSELERWKAAAEKEMNGIFEATGAFHVSTKEEREKYGRPLPMLCVWSVNAELRKCRACICGNFAKLDPTQQSWTAQAEPSSMLCSLKLGVKNQWMISKHDVKGAFLNASLPTGQLVVVQPPDLWVKWGIVPAGVTWTLDKAVYGLRESPFLWSQERDKQLTLVRWTVGGKTYRLRQGDSDSQLWFLQEDHK